MKTARSIPNVQVYARHREDCKWLGKNRRIGCDCRVRHFSCFLRSGLPDSRHRYC